KGEVIVAEGYMDVIALNRAGFANAVAPLGTALTETQVRELWRLAPEPVICFDGDAAGRRAAQRAVERALPVLQPGRSLRFAFLPPGEDPDSVIVRRGVPALEETLARARPLADMLWEMETAGRSIDTPERRAALEKRLNDGVRRVADASVRRHYERHFKSRLWEAFKAARPAGRGPGSGPGRRPAPVLAEPPLADGLAGAPQGQGERRERLLVGMILNHPELLVMVEEEFATVAIVSPELDSLRKAILDIRPRDSGLDSGALKRHLSARGMGTAVDRLSAPLEWSERRLEDRFARADAPLSELVEGWRHVVARHGAAALEAELEAAVEDLAENMTDEAVARVQALKRQIERSAGNEADLDPLESEPGAGNPN
ncbi:MAG: toprim domain-containing protein, partial [Alphaproteobacteria bacterium]